MRFAAVLLLASLTISTSAQKFIKTDKHGAIKKIRSEAGPWLDSIEIAANPDAAVYIAGPDTTNPSGLALIGYGKYRVTLYVAYKTPTACMADHQDIDDVARATTCSTVHYAREILAVFYSDQKARLLSRADISDDGEIRPATPIQKSAVPFQHLSPVIATSIETVQKLAVKLYPEVAMTAPPAATCTEVAGVRRVGGDIKPPRILRQPNPDYTEEARHKHISGETVIELVVDVDGTPKCIHVVHPLPYGLSQKAMEAVSQYVFEPATVGGKPVPVVLNVAVDFRIFRR